MNEHGLDTTIHRKFTTVSFNTGAPASFTGSPALAIYEDNSLVEFTTGLTLVTNFDGVTGLNMLTLVINAANGFEVGKHYDVVVTSGSVDGVSAVGDLAYSFDVIEPVESRVWDESISNHLTPGSTGNALNAAGSSGDPWATELPGAYGTGTAGKLIGNNINAPLGVIYNLVDAIKAVTDQLPDGGTLTSLPDDAALSAVGAEVSSILAEVTHVTHGLSEIKTDTAATLNDTNELQSDWANGGRLDSLLDSRMAESSISTTGGAIDNVLLVNTCTTNTDMRGTDGANTAAPDNAGISAIAGYLDTEIASIIAAIGSPSGVSLAADIASVKAETAAIVADTDQIQTEWANGGRLDNLLDSRASQATADAIEADTQDLQNRVPAALTSGSMDVNVVSIDDNAAAGTNLSKHALRVKEVTFSGGTTTSAVFVNVGGSSASSVDDVYNGRTLVFSAPSVLEDQACTIVDYDGATKTATISAVTTAVTSGAVAMLE